MNVMPYSKFEQRCKEVNQTILKTKQKIDILNKLNFARYRFLAKYSSHYGIKEGQFEVVYKTIIKKNAENGNGVYKVKSAILR